MAASQTAREQDERRWSSRPVLATLVQALVIGIPIGVSMAAVAVAREFLPPVRSSGSRVWQIALLMFVAVVTATACERVARKLLPLAALLKLTMLFPDRAPSRFKVARRANATKLLQDRAESGDGREASAAESILALLAALSSHDSRTRGHAERVRVYTDLLAEQFDLPQHDRDRLRWAALLHDIGKITIAPDLLNKPSKPNAREWETLRSHPDAGARLVAPLMPFLGEWGTAISQHHERYDGTGYPRGLTAGDITFAGRLVAVVDAYEVMTAARSYKRASSTKHARAELARCAGTHFDPEIVRAFLAISLPRLLWATGPLSFLAQIPFISGIRQAAVQVSAQPIAVAQSVTLAAAGFAGGTGVAAASHGVPWLETATVAVERPVTHQHAHAMAAASGSHRSRTAVATPAPPAGAWLGELAPPIVAASRALTAVPAAASSSAAPTALSTSAPTAAPAAAPSGSSVAPAGASAPPDAATGSPSLSAPSPAGGPGVGHPGPPADRPTHQAVAPAAPAHHHQPAPAPAATHPAHAPAAAPPSPPAHSGDGPGKSGNTGTPGPSGNTPGTAGDAPGKAGNAPGKSGDAPGKSDHGTDNGSPAPAPAASQPAAPAATAPAPAAAPSSGDNGPPGIVINLPWPFGDKGDRGHGHDNGHGHG